MAVETATRREVLPQLFAAIHGIDYATDSDSVAARSQDRGEPFGASDALAVVRPASTADVSRVLRAASTLQIPVVPQGSLTGLAGGAAALSGSILLDLTGLDKIVDIDVANGLAVVEPGVGIEALDLAARNLGFMYAPDPASAAWASIGGSIATNAGGMRCIKYGVTRDAVRALEVVLADGTVIDTRTTTIKSVSGLDLTGLFVGSEGTLGVVTKAWLNIVPVPGQTRAVVSTFASVEHALDAANELAILPRTPATLEFLDSTALKAIRQYAPELDLPTGAEAWLFAVTDNAEGWEQDLQTYEDIVRTHGALAVRSAVQLDEVEDASAARRLLNQGMRAYLGGSLNGDVAVPRSQLAAYCQSLAPIAQAHGVEIAVGGHVGDGNLHPVVAYPSHSDVAAARAHEAMVALWHRAQELGGTVTGEHGIGVEKLSEVGRELSDRVLAIQRGIKDLLDPNHILNPGKKYPLAGE